MELDFALRFSEDSYLTIDEIRTALKTSSVDLIWEKVQAYRHLYSVSIDLPNCEDKLFSYTLTRSLVKKIIRLEREMTSLIVSFDHLDSEAQKSLVNDHLFAIAATYAKINSLTITNDELNNIIYNQTVEIPQAFRSLRNYINLIKTYMFSDQEELTINEIASVYGQFVRKDFSGSFENLFRETDLINPDDHKEKGSHYEAAPLDKIKSMLSDLLSFLSNNEEIPLIKSSILLFYLTYIVPFNYFNEECNLILFKYLLGGKNYKILTMLMNFEEEFLECNSLAFKSAFLSSEKTLDLTYFINYVVNKVSQAIDAFTSVKKVMFDKEVILPKKEEKKEAESFNQESPTIVVERKVALPTLPEGLKADEIELVANSLVELYPSLKSGQAYFYAAHCVVGKYYTIAQYKKEMNVAYETARTSMDNLANLGLYKKENVKNKFVYTPVIQKEEEEL